ncbi:MULTISPECIES: aldo/keto reductase [unclassified Sphingopyxis]|uniref:aldo/keto reductase n=1 Tax=unclassified Sphingopyxis TaxID=2614943 RepID=UPI00072FBDE8|nr:MULTISPECIES: aldo/keto reductase [unclassified Sphingopyxis]KTE24522.1 aldo/keto reductase [Sphingopyxis sp. H057]KTE49500.1 aldo/keto reductase [Sphingopyxis sp. H071]KTE52193.1 aldo/keto reductase [Sphingopyxis sp. H073]KTE60474.1 aldo/keto reductase [Sphingopyxis sp. H107]KTE63937.1 aldo/keto reductase [Sphingopyxis sp. H100]
MQSRRLGKSAIHVSDICMGTMTFGSQTDEAEAFRILDRCFDEGINFYDTAEGYPVPPDTKWVGRTEEIVGRWLKTKNRDAIILATKVSGPSHVWFKSPCRGGMTALDRHNIRSAIEASLTRLQTDYVDLYQTHWPDHDAPYDEIMDALDELVREGKVRILGCSNETSWGLMKSLAASERLGAQRYHTIQNNFSLNNRRFEDELAQVCRQEGVSLIPYSPLAGGVLSGKYQDGATPEGARFSRYLAMEGRQAAMGRRFVNEKSLAATERYLAIAEEHGLHPVTMATAWSKQHDFVASTIVGVSAYDQVDPILAAKELVLSDDLMKALHKVGKDILYPMG